MQTQIREQVGWLCARQVCPAIGEIVYIGYNLKPTDGMPYVDVGMVNASRSMKHKVTLPNMINI